MYEASATYVDDEYVDNHDYDDDTDDGTPVGGGNARSERMRATSGNILITHTVAVSWWSGGPEL